MTRHVVRVRKPRRVYPVPGCAHAAAHKAIIAAIALAKLRAHAINYVPTSDDTTARRLADWWDVWKISLRKVILAATNTARQGLIKNLSAATASSLCPTETCSPGGAYP